MDDHTTLALGYQNIGLAYSDDVSFVFYKIYGDAVVKYLEMLSRGLHGRLEATLLSVCTNPKRLTNKFDTLTPKCCESILFEAKKIESYLATVKEEIRGELPEILKQIKELIFKLPLRTLDVPPRTGKAPSPSQKFSVFNTLGSNPKNETGSSANDNPLDTSDLSPDHDIYGFMDWKFRKPMGLRGPENFIWAIEEKQLGYIHMTQHMTTYASQTMVDEYYAVDEAGNSRVYKAAAHPELLEAVATDGDDSAVPLQQTILPSDLPEFLIVVDPDASTDHRRFRLSDGKVFLNNNLGTTTQTVTYRRVNPLSIGVPWVALPRNRNLGHSIAQLRISHSEQLGSGHSGIVYRASFSLSLTGSSQTTFLNAQPVTVAAKIPYPSLEAAAFVLNEAKTYQLFPRYLSQNWSGYQVLPNETEPYPPVAVVPKYYGYYVPDKGTDHQPILLMEECGKPVGDGCGDSLSLSQKQLVFSLVRRLHLARFLQRSMSGRNILIQPGPLRLPRSDRSMDIPSFRVIDFGRAEYFGEGAWDDEARRLEELAAGRELKLPQFPPEDE